MPAVHTSNRADTVTRALCIVVLAAVVMAAAYTAWIAISNYSRIAV